jgi:phosphoserine phosphatase RsbU/P
MRILLVDDDAVARRILLQLLRRQGHEVVEASDGEGAWEILVREQLSFVVSDWLMPGMTGVELCRRIRGAAFDRYIYIILCTSKGAKSDLVEGMDAGADDFLVKPISPEELRVKVRAGERILSLERGLAEKNRELEETNQRLQSAHKLIEDDLIAAAWMQTNLLPCASPQAHGLRCEWHLEPCGYIAGDIFNFFPMGERHVGFYLLDVSGHGVPAAMLSVTLSTILSPESSIGNPLKRWTAESRSFEILSPREALRELNLRFQAKDDRYFTMVYGLYDTQDGTLKIAQAGHPGPVLIRKGGQIECLGSGGMPLGVWPEIDFDCFEVRPVPGDRLLLYSDGFTECTNPQGMVFGEARLQACLEGCEILTLDGLITILMEEIKTWRGVPTFSDDISLLAIEFA